MNQERWNYIKQLAPPPGRYIHISKRLEYFEPLNVYIVSSEPGRTRINPKRQAKKQARKILGVSARGMRKFKRSMRG